MAPTGFSAIIGPDGTVEQRTAVSEQAVLHGTVELRSGTTLYTRLGYGPAVVVALASLALGWLVARRGALARTPRGRGDRSDVGCPRAIPTAMRPARGPSPRQTSRTSVTGPSLTRATRMSARNRPVATSAPSPRSPPTTASTSGSACSGRAAATQLGRRPRLVSP